MAWKSSLAEPVDFSRERLRRFSVACVKPDRMARLDELPDDPALLKRLLTERDVLIERIKEEAADRLAEQAERIKPEAAEQLEALRLRMEVEKKAAIAVEVKAAVDAVVRRFHRPRSDGSMLVNCCCSVSVSKSCRSTSQASQKKRAKS